MNYIVLDIGNTNIKMGSFIGNKLANVYYLKKLNEVIEKLQNLKHDQIISCSVSVPVEDQKKHFQKLPVFYMTHDTPLPIQNRYQTISTLGLDRIAAVVGAQTLCPDEDVLTIDIGTCITYDLLDRKGNYHGGSISPGIELRFKSMHDYTEKLPLIPPHEINHETPLVGTTTSASLVSGVIYGITSELEGMITAFKQNYPGLKVILCGGETNRFESKLKESIFACPELVLIGLKRILEYNEK